MRATVIVSKDADFSQNPVGFVDVNPIPDAARQGLQAALLTTKSEKAATLDRVTGKFLPLDADMDENVQFFDDRVTLTNRQAGYIAEEWPNINYTSGYTIIMVVKLDTDFNGSTGAPIIASLDAGTNLPAKQEARGFRVAIRRSTILGMATSQANTHAAIDTRTFSGEESVMAGFSYDPSAGTNGQCLVAIPARGTRFPPADLTPKPEPGQPASADAGVAILREPQPSDTGDRLRTASFIAQYDRPMTHEEVDEICQVLRPWLSSVGIEAV